MTDPLRARILRALDALPDEKAMLVLDYVEFLESKYAARARPDNLFARLVDTVGDTMRAGKLPLDTITGTLGAMDSAQKLMKGLAAAGEAVIDEVGRAVTPSSPPPQGSLPPAGTRTGAPPSGTGRPELPAGTKPPAPPPSAE